MSTHVHDRENFEHWPSANSGPRKFFPLYRFLYIPLVCAERTCFLGMKITQSWWSCILGGTHCPGALGTYTDKPLSFIISGSYIYPLCVLRGPGLWVWSWSRRPTLSTGSGSTWWGGSRELSNTPASWSSCARAVRGATLGQGWRLRSVSTCMCEVFAWGSVPIVYMYVYNSRNTSNIIIIIFPTTFKMLAHNNSSL